MGKEIAFPGTEVKEIEAKSTDITAEATKLKVTSQPKYEIATGLIRQVVELKKAVHDTFDPVVKAAHAAHKEATAARKKHLDPLDRAERYLRTQMSGYAAEQERKREEKERKRRAEIEAKMKAKRDAEAAALREEGADEEAEELMEQPVIVPEVSLPDKTKQDGLTYRDDWKFRIQDSMALKRWLITTHPAMLKVDEVTLGKLVRSMKENSNIPGIQVYKEKVPVLR